MTIIAQFVIFCKKKYDRKAKSSNPSVTALYGRGDRVRVSGGHLCAKHRSTDRGGSRDLEPAASSASPPPCGSQSFVVPCSGTKTLTAALRYARFIVLRTRSQPHPKQALALSAKEKSSNPSVTAYMVEATGFEPAASCSQSKRATKLRHASILFTF